MRKEALYVQRKESKLEHVGIDLERNVFNESFCSFDQINFVIPLIWNTVLDSMTVG